MSPVSAIAPEDVCCQSTGNSAHDAYGAVVKYAVSCVGRVPLCRTSQASQWVLLVHVQSHTSGSTEELTAVNLAEVLRASQGTWQ